MVGSTRSQPFKLFGLLVQTLSKNACGAGADALVVPDPSAVPPMVQGFSPPSFSDVGDECAPVGRVDGWVGHPVGHSDFNLRQQASAHPQLCVYQVVPGQVALDPFPQDRQLSLLCDACRLGSEGQVVVEGGCHDLACGFDLLGLQVVQNVDREDDPLVGEGGVSNLAGVSSVRLLSDVVLDRFLDLFAGFALLLQSRQLQLLLREALFSGQQTQRIS